ncbi:MAG TPA: sulfur carrier protein ThiS, partial [Chitinivibrionales bacterium]|nr:sulfur carrier protein ThiS [Chitinivibrionales bacterium]
TRPPDRTRELRMHVTVNGNNETIDTGMSLERLLASRAINPQAVVVEVNFDIVPRGRLASVTLKEGDTVEILRFVGGG